MIWVGESSLRVNLGGSFPMKPADWVAGHFSPNPELLDCLA